MATIFVTHDLGVACEVADQIAVMYAGRFVETGTAVDVMAQPEPPLHRGFAALDGACRRDAAIGSIRSRDHRRISPTCRRVARSRRAAAMSVTFAFPGRRSWRADARGIGCAVCANRIWRSMSWPRLRRRRVGDPRLPRRWAAAAACIRTIARI